MLYEVITDQGGGHDQELTGHLYVEGLHQVQVFQVLLGYGMNRDIIDIDLILVNEVEEKVQGTFEDRQLDLDRGFFHRLKVSLVITSYSIHYTKLYEKNRFR